MNKIFLHKKNCTQTQTRNHFFFTGNSLLLLGRIKTKVRPDEAIAMGGGGVRRAAEAWRPPSAPSP